MIKKSIVCILSLALLASCGDLELNGADVAKSDASTSASESTESDDSSGHSEVVLDGGSDSEAGSEKVFGPSESEAATATSPVHDGFYQLITNFENMSGADIASALISLNETELLQLSIYPAFAGLVHLRGCEANANLIIQTSQGVENCQQQNADWENHFQLTLQLFGSLNNAFEQAIRERGQLQVAVGCSNGSIDAASCQAYINGTAQINQNYNDTAKTIIANLGNGSCDANLDANCQAL